MSIVTKTGDFGKTTLYNDEIISKAHLRIETCGSLDEMNSFLGLVKSSTDDIKLKNRISKIQQDFVSFGEIISNPSSEKEVEDNKINSVEEQINDIEKNIRIGNWKLPGENLTSVSLDLARTSCRKFERNIVKMHEEGFIDNPNLMKYVNRMSDFLWLLARQQE